MVTLICSVIGIGGLLYLLWIATDRVALLGRPYETLNRVIGAELDSAEVADKLAPWERTLAAATGFTPDKSLKRAINAYREYDQKFPREGAEDTLIVLLLEAGQTQKASEILNRQSELDVEFELAICALYSIPVPEKRWPISIERDPAYSFQHVVDNIDLPWAKDRLALRIAEKDKDAQAIAKARAAMERRGLAIQKRTAQVEGYLLGVLGLGLIACIAWCAQRFPDLTLAPGIVVAPWNFGLAYAVFIRAEILGGIAVLLASLSAEFLPALNGFTTLISAIPLLFLVSYFFSIPWRRALFGTFGLDILPGRWLRLIQVTSMIACVNLAGTVLLSALMQKAGFEMHWAETVPEEFLWGSRYTVALQTLDMVLWAPIFEELLFRGFVFVTLRRYMPMLPSALLTALLFSVVHGYSPVGFVVVAWSGLLWSISYEKTRSLAPGMIDHALNNALVTAVVTLTYRPV